MLGYSMTEFLSVSQCKKRRLYRFQARNFWFGVFQGTGFIGIREKFGSQFLCTEYHWDEGPPFGTVLKVREAGEDLPEGIPLREEDNEALFNWLMSYWDRETLNRQCPDCGALKGVPCDWAEKEAGQKDRSGFHASRRWDLGL